MPLLGYVPQAYATGWPGDRRQDGIFTLTEPFVNKEFYKSIKNMDCIDRLQIVGPFHGQLRESCDEAAAIAAGDERELRPRGCRA